MTVEKTGLKAAAAIGTLAIALAACGGGGSKGSSDDGTPQKGGTLKIAGSSPPDHVDPASAYTTVNQGFSRNWALTLFANKASNNFSETIPNYPDAAAELPTKENGGISADGKTYTIKLRDGLKWNTNPARPVTAADFVRGLKRTCNPAKPAGAPYYTDLIEGMADFCKGYAKVDPKSAKAMGDYQEGHDVSGYTAKDDKTLVVKLKQPAGDFLNIIGMSFASAAPKEYDNYIPDSPEFRQHTVSDGPYQMTSYSDKKFVLERNPNWDAASDKLRKAYVDRIEVDLGQDSPDQVQQQLEQGTADLAWDQPVPTTAIPRLAQDKNKQFRLQDNPAVNPYIVFNLLSPNNKGALAKKEVRQAIEYAIDKVAIAKNYGGVNVAQPVHSAVAPGNVGYDASFNPYPTPNDSGDPAKCKQMLAAAGYANGLTLKFPYRTNSNHPRNAQSIQANLQACGITVQMAPDTNGNFYGTTLVTPADAKAGKWDIAAPGWGPDWYGNNGRSGLQPLFDGRAYGPNSVDYGDYNNPQVNAAIDKANQAQSPTEAQQAWLEVNKLVMGDAAIVPLITQKYSTYQASRVRNAQFLPAFQTYDYSLIWLAKK
ncbi:ABC transporter substrate-binding protein [Actinoallomurus sp. NPDC052274]|uniref:ABC transporter substrate-binding protein n=1 Tax=Actinoallomurus sp. NPDC052274 TaxID=3155420 RepID=UPI003430429D